MANDQGKEVSAMDTRKKVIIGVIVLVAGFLIYEVVGMFGGTAAPATDAGTGTAANGAPPAPVTRPVVAKIEPLSPREMELMKLQQETQAKYVAAVNELQMLKLSLEIAETNKGIVAAKLETIKNQKDIVDLLSPPKPVAPNYGENLNIPNAVQPPEPSPAEAASNAPPPLPSSPALSPQLAAQQQVLPVPKSISPPEEMVAYTVVSVSELQHKWSAVIGVQGNLYSVHVGDILSADGSKVKSISSAGIMLEKDGKERKVSLVPII